MLFACIIKLNAQKADSLIHLLPSGKKDTTQVILLNDIAWELFQVASYDSCILYARSAKELAAATGYKKGMASAYCHLGNCAEKRGRYPEALNNHYAALKLVTEINNIKAMASCRNNIGIVYENQGNYTEALKSYYASQELYEKAGDKRGVALLYGAIGGVYKWLKKYPEALKSLTTSLRMHESYGTRRDMIFTYANIGNLYANINNKQEALKNHSLALTIAKEVNDREAISFCYNDMANIYADMGNYDEALKNYFASLALATESGLTSEVATTYGNIGSVYIDQKNYVKAQKYISLALELSKQLQSKELLRDHYVLQVMIDSASGNYNAAFEHTKLKQLYNDSIHNKENSAQINELSARYESEKKEKEIALLNARLAIRQKDVEEKNTLIIATLMGAALLITAVLLFFGWGQLKQRREINEQQKNIAASIIQAQEKERNSIAKDLHDGVGTYLSTLKLNLQLLEPAVASEKKSSYQNVLELTDRTSLELRNITKNISSETLLESGLPAALEELAHSVNQLGLVQLTFITHGLTNRLQEILEVTLYRIAQELVINCVKHAQSQKATLQLIAHTDSLLLMLEDNGKGFSPPSSRPKGDTGGMGLKNIYDRVNFIKGTIKIESDPKKGTIFIIEAPKYLN